MKIINSILIIVVTIGFFILAIDKYNQKLSTRHGVVRANIIEISPEVSGRIESVKVNDNQVVKKGDILFIINNDDYLLEVKQARDNYRLVKKHLDELDLEIISAKAYLRKAEQQYEYASKRYKRIQSLHSKEYISTDNLDKIKTEFYDAKNNFISANSTLQKISIERGAIGKNNIDLKKAQLDLDKALLNLDRTVIYAPTDGRIVSVNIHTGDYVNTGKAVVAEVDSDSIWIEGVFPETVIDKIKVGEFANISLMSNEDVSYTGYVASIGTAINSKELPLSSALIPDLPQVFKWVRLAENIPVHIKLDNYVDTTAFIVGQTATVTILK
ncbi:MULTISPECIES: HlyD family secretion protein [unclassified Photobacterium]|uniref:HlyD family secretion protein n=1 Tax=unclassified Photobacterium TaxID=2628852 RepID=UPI001EDFDD39|nr:MULTISPECIES: HlyD family secretion protein [unclassified Photobacterium]MCG3864792.1 HlyD family secretion protein [Photobacterium sp. Ph6]MCG3876212.1 HlyD family secretion protein [Photobacterium sp. Ph5]